MPGHRDRHRLPRRVDSLVEREARRDRAAAKEARTAAPGGTDQPPPAPDTTPSATADGAAITRLLFPDAPPERPDAWHVNGERMDLEFVVWALLAQRDLARRLAAEQGAAEQGAAEPGVAERAVA